MSTPQRRRVWPRALAAVGVVAVIGAGLGAYLGIRVAQGAGSASTAGQPSARFNAAMAFDPANGTVVLFGGQGKTNSLGDTWSWNGSAWTQEHPSTSPPPLAGAQMTYDPVSRKMLLIGGQRIRALPDGGDVCSSSSGSASGSSGSSGSQRFIPPTGAIPADAPAPGGNVGGAAILPDCGFPDAGNAATWLWDGSNWSKAATTTPSMMFGGTLVTDPASQRALLLATQSFEPMPMAPMPEPAIACPLQEGTPTGATAKPSCPIFPIPTRSWMWTGSAWKAMTVTPAGREPFDSIVVDGVTGKLARFGGESFPISPATCPDCAPGPQIKQAACCSGTVSLWTGTSWKRSATYTNGPSLGGGVLIGDPAAHSDVYLAPDGQTWTWTGVWKHAHPDTTPSPLSGTAAAYDAATSQVVRFGGIATTERATGIYNQTWIWDGSDWALRGGSNAPGVTIPVPSPISVPPSLPCRELKPPVTLPAASGLEPDYACGGSASPGSVSGSPGSAAGGTPGSAGGATGVSGSASGPAPTAGVVTP